MKIVYWSKEDGAFIAEVSELAGYLRWRDISGIVGGC